MVSDDDVSHYPHAANFDELRDKETLRVSDDDVSPYQMLQILMN